MSTVILLDINGIEREVSYEACIYFMDDYLAEKIHDRLAPCTDQEFLDAYVKAHKAVFDEHFSI